jgi:excinuclease UvrABC nuclease subunit
MTSIRSHKWRFTRSMIADAPNQPGIYALWEDGSLLYVGRTGREETIRSKLAEYVRGEIGAQLRRATHYSWEICSDLAAREAQILANLDSYRTPEASRPLPRAAGPR